MSAKFVLSAVFAVLFVSGLVNAAAIKVIVNDVTPQPVEPGSDLTLRVTYSNVDSDFVRPTARLDLRYPFSLKTSTEPFDDGFDLCGYCSRINTYFITVDTAAASGIYPIFIRTSMPESVRTINVSIRGRPNIVLSSERLTNVTQGNLVQIDTSLINIGTGLASQVKITSKSSDFVSIGSSVKTIDVLKPGNQTYASFFMIAGTNLKAGAYSLPFEVNYYDESGTLHNSTQNIGVNIVNEGKLNIESIKVTAASGEAMAGSPVSIIVRIENTGYGNADSIVSELSCNSQSIRSFLGQLKRDEDAPAVFELTLSGGYHECTMTTNYSDDLGQHVIVNMFDVNIKNPGFPVTYMIILIIIIGFLYYKFVRKKKQ